MAYCLPKFEADALRQKILSGEISPEKLGEMTSAQRRATFSKLMPSAEAVRVNALFESKLLLKNQEQGMVTWARQVLGEKHPMYRDTLSKIKKLEDVLTTKDKDLFLEDLVEMKLGMKITQAEGARLFELSKKIEESKAVLPQKLKEVGNDAVKSRDYLKGETKADFKQRMQYGMDVAIYKDYVETINPKSNVSLKDTVKSPTALAGLSKSLVSSMDNGFHAIQGVFSLWNPSTTGMWGKNFIRSFDVLARSVKNPQHAKLLVQAEIYSRPNAINGNYGRMRLATGLRAEESFPVLIHEKLPGVGRLYKASNNAYNLSAIRLRADLADMHLYLAKKMKIDLTNTKEIQGIGEMVNSITGRGGLGRFEGAGNTLNAWFFSPRLMAATVKNLAPWTSKKIQGSKYARKAAAQNLLKITATYYTLMGTLEMMFPGTTELDPRKPHFGQVKIGDDTWMNVLGPIRPIVRALAVIVPTYRHDAGDTLSERIGFHRMSRNGKWTTIHLYPDKAPKYGAYTPLDVLEDFIQGKASPLAARLVSMFKGQEYMGEERTPATDLKKTALPISVQSLLDEMERTDEYDEIFRNITLEFLGVGVTTED